MIQRIKSCDQLHPYLHDRIEDQGIEVEIAPNLAETKLAIVKVDDYYNDLHMGVTPKAIDFCVVVDCACDWYSMYLLELKNVNSPKYLKLADICEKFDNTINDFLSMRFKDIFLDDRYKYKSIKLYLVSDAYGMNGRYKNFDEFKRAQERKQRINSRDSLKVDFNLGTKLYKFRGKVLSINFDIPPNPIISGIS